MSITKYSTPAYVNDLPNILADQWSAIIDAWFETAIDRLVTYWKLPPDKIFLYNLLRHPEVNGTATEIPWNAYPRKYTLTFSNEEDKWHRTEMLYNSDLGDEMNTGLFYLVGANYIRATDFFFRDQDEYCEWRPVVDPQTQKLKKLVFTCENPEYWTFIADKEKDLLLKLYRDITQGNVLPDDLFFQQDIYMKDDSGQFYNIKGQYNPYNKWNTSLGIVHLTHPANSLSAEVYLAADATVIRKNAAGAPVTNDKDLICCSGYGNPNRSSDPSIGIKINTFVQNHYSITINDPVGLYMKSIDSSGVVLPGGLQFADCWKITRGKEGMILRAEFALPDGSDLEKVQVRGKALRYGGQLAEKINMVIYGLGNDFNLGDPVKYDCVAHCCVNSILPGLLDVKDIDQPCGSHHLAVLTMLESVQAAGVLEAKLSHVKGNTPRKIIKTRI
ncbi:MAG TPA: hypothetical protein VNS58_09110 [Puia sp.]|nr:hypothetical protein [Puia sp.]